MAYVDGGVCNVYDWTPLPAAREPWKQLQKACRENDVAYYIWLSGASQKYGAFADRVGYDPEHWAYNDPTTAGNDTYGLNFLKHNVLSPAFRKEYDRTLEALRSDYGYQGFWGDSFQNLFMTQLDWASGGGNAMGRAWWEWLAGYTRNGVSWMAESHSFPGMSCSIEVRGWAEHWWAFHQVCKWYRGPEQRHYEPEQLERNLFRVMSVGGWTAPDWKLEVIPHFSEFAEQYLKALPRMARPYLLDDEAGVLWLSGKDDEGVWFSFSNRPVPDGVKAFGLLKDSDRVTRASRHAVYRVEAKDLAKRFGVRTGPGKDPRRGWEFDPPQYTWPKHAK
jgi:hypothetical protein